jgi:hypothetical protein
MATAVPMGWLAAARAYLVAAAVGHLLWEAVHLPLYTLWRTADTGGER